MIKYCLSIKANFLCMLNCLIYRLHLHNYSDLFNHSISHLTITWQCCRCQSTILLSTVNGDWNAACSPGPREGSANPPSTKLSRPRYATCHIVYKQNIENSITLGNLKFIVMVLQQTFYILRMKSAIGICAHILHKRKTDFITDQGIKTLCKELHT